MNSSSIRRHGAVVISTVLMLLTGQSCEQGSDSQSMSDNLHIRWDSGPVFVKEYIVYLGDDTNADDEIRRVDTSMTGLNHAAPQWYLPINDAFKERFPAGRICIKLQAVNQAGMSSISEPACTTL